LSRFTFNGADAGNGFRPVFICPRRNGYGCYFAILSFPGLCAAALLWSSLGYSQQYFRFTGDQDHLAGAPDESLLNRPLAPGDRLNGLAV
jgi:hypothetical protein